MDKTKPPKRNRPRKPKLSVVVPFPEDRVVRYRDFENLIRRLRRAKEHLSDILILGVLPDNSLYVQSNGISKKDALWLLEMGKLDVLGLLTDVEE